MNRQKAIYLFQLVIVGMLATACVSLPPLRSAIYDNDVEAARRAIEQGADVNEPNVNGDTPLLLAVWLKRKDIVQLLIDKGADPNIRGLRSHMTPRMAAEADNQLEIARILKDAEADGPPQEKARFEQAVQMSRDTAAKPVFPEEARKYKIQAEAAVRDKQFKKAADAYRQALDAAPWWPEGHFNRALVLGEIRSYRDAIREMKRYLILAPNAANARAAQDKIYEWEGRAQH